MPLMLLAASAATPGACSRSSMSLTPAVLAAVRRSGLPFFGHSVAVPGSIDRRPRLARPQHAQADWVEAADGRPSKTAALLWPTRTASVRFAVPLRVNYGETLKLLGSSPELGMWDIKKGLELQWSHGDRWHGSVELPLGEHEFKFIIIRQGGWLEWEPSSNRSFQVEDQHLGQDAYINCLWGSPTGTHVAVSAPGASAAAAPAHSPSTSDPAAAPEDAASRAAAALAAAAAARRAQALLPSSQAQARAPAGTVAGAGDPLADSEALRKLFSKLECMQGELDATRAELRESRQQNTSIQLELQQLRSTVTALDVWQPAGSGGGSHGAQSSRHSSPGRLQDEQQAQEHGTTWGFASWSQPGSAAAAAGMNFMAAAAAVQTIAERLPQATSYIHEITSSFSNSSGVMMAEQQLLRQHGVEHTSAVQGEGLSSSNLPELQRGMKQLLQELSDLQLVASDLQVTMEGLQQSTSTLQRAELSDSSIIGSDGSSIGSIGMPDEPQQRVLEPAIEAAKPVRRKRVHREAPAPEGAARATVAKSKRSRTSRAAGPAALAADGAADAGGTGDAAAAGDASATGAVSSLPSPVEETAGKKPRRRRASSRVTSVEASKTEKQQQQQQQQQQQEEEEEQQQEEEQDLHAEAQPLPPPPPKRRGRKPRAVVAATASTGEAAATPAADAAEAAEAAAAEQQEQQQQEEQGLHAKALPPPPPRQKRRGRKPRAVVAIAATPSTGELAATPVAAAADAAGSLAAEDTWQPPAALHSHDIAAVAASKPSNLPRRAGRQGAVQPVAAAPAPAPAARKTSLSSPAARKASAAASAIGSNVSTVAALLEAAQPSKPPGLVSSLVARIMKRKPSSASAQPV